MSPFVAGVLVGAAGTLLHLLIAVFIAAEWSAYRAEQREQEGLERSVRRARE